MPLLGSRTLVRELAHDLKFGITVPYGAWFHKGQVRSIVNLIIIHVSYAGLYANTARSRNFPVIYHINGYVCHIENAASFVKFSLMIHG